MTESIGFKNLPFKADTQQIIYTENEYNEAINSFIRNNIAWINNLFQTRFLEFVYIPFLGADENAEERVKYYAPYLTGQITDEYLPQSSLLLRCMARPENRKDIGPSLIKYLNNESDEEVFRMWRIDPTDEETIRGSFQKLISDLTDTRRYNLEFDDDIRYSKKVTHTPNNSRFSIRKPRVDLSSPTPPPVTTPSPSPAPKKKNTERSRKSPLRSIKETIKRITYASLCEDDGSVCAIPDVACCIIEPYLDEEPIEEILDDLQLTVKRLQLKGISLAAIHELIDKQEKLSRVVITADYRIFLPDYNNIEIEMTILPKTLFFFFLRYPEGIVLKSLLDHQREIINIYKQLKPKADEARLRLTIEKLVNPLGNSINENIARVRAAFVKKFDEHLAQNYFVTGKRGEEYRINLDRNLVEWQEE